MDAKDYSRIVKIIATHCCVCRTRLTDAESVEHGIGPVCSRKYYDPVHVPSPAQVQRALGMLAAANLPDPVTDACAELVNDRSEANARKMSNLLVYYASAHYSERDAVLKCATIIRALGYTVLANKLETDRTAASLLDDGSGKLEVYLPDKYEVTKEVRRIPGYEPIMIPVEDPRVPLVGTDTRPPIYDQAKQGRKLGWHILREHRAHLDCILGVFLGGELVNYGDSNLHPAPRRRRHELLAFAPVERKTGSVRVETEGQILSVYTPYRNDAFVIDLKTKLPSKDRHWNGTCWEVGAKHRGTLATLIELHFK